jgi:DNA mismatch repair protein MutL
MSPQIRPLDAHIINQIAAGEVIEGPFSAVKELVENAIDAQASEIRVEIRQGGKSLISVTDNGVGIPGDEIETAFLPHTTSKLRSIEDLQRIHTLGFRGEALASIASVALVEINTRETNAAVGYKAVFKQGRLQSMEETGCPAGTQIQIRDLFHSTPARLKFMKSDGAESSKITDMLTKLALSRPDIAFQYVNNNSIMLTTRRSVDLLQTAMTIFPPEIARGLFWAAEQTYARDDLRIDIKGLIGQPQTTKGNRSYQLFFVNGRTVKSELMTHAYESAYEGSVMVNRFPVGILYVEISPHILDVNVHPSKTTIKFQEPEWIDESIAHFVKQALQQKAEILRPVFREKKTVQPEISAAENVPVSEQIELQMDSRISIGKNVTEDTEFTIKHDNLNIVVKEPVPPIQYSSHEHSSQTLFLENVLQTADISWWASLSKPTYCWNQTTTCT